MSDVKTSGSKAVRDMYDAAADSYSEMMDSEINHPLYSDTLDRLHKRIANLSGTLIDAPCGSGHMLSMYHDNYEADRPLLGIDLSHAMVEIASKRLGSAAEIISGDIRSLDNVKSDSAAAVISHFAFHHLDADGVSESLKEWHRVLQAGGQLVIGAWAGSGAIDYGGQSDLVAIKHEPSALEAIVRERGFVISQKTVEFDPDMNMDAIYIEAAKE